MTMIVTEDRRMKEILELARTVALSKATVLVQGESGTGKERIAELIHQSSARAAKPFILMNCASTPKNLIESELFGYERGSFSGSGQAKIGKFELANGGTLLLDEVSELSLEMQEKILDVIQSGEVQKWGSKSGILIDIRIIATSHKNLSECVRAGTFREDLFYRLNVVTLSVPPLRERTADIVTLAQKFVRDASEKHSKSLSGVSPEAIHRLVGYAWPGNVRQLQTVMDRSVLTSKGNRIEANDIQLEEMISKLASENRAAAEMKWNPGATLNDIEKKIILDALGYHKGNRTHTAKALGISIRTLRNKLADYRKEGIYA